MKVKEVQLRKIRGYPSHPFLARIAKERSGAGGVKIKEGTTFGRLRVIPPISFQERKRKKRGGCGKSKSRYACKRKKGGPALKEKDGTTFVYKIGRN